MGAIYKYEFPEGTWRTLFITSYEIFDIYHVNDITELQIEFEDKTIGNLKLTPDWVKWLWKSPRDKLNVTVMEFSATALKVLSSSKYASLTFAIPIKDSKVTLFDNANGIISGKIRNINGDFIEFTSEMKSKTGNAGAPLLSEGSCVVGIYTGLWDFSDESAPQLTNSSHKATNIKSVLDAFQAYVMEQLGGKSENELWLERMNQMPKNELQLIGSGGFGKVYKMKEKSSSETLVAVKIVSGIGSLNEYADQVDALQREYRVVTRLGNHPRIIQFFAIVRDEKNFQIMIVMEFLEGASLADKLKDQKPLPDSSVLKYLVQILEGVSFIHRKGIYHSDIKPANILFNSEDNLKISDFGIAVGGQLATTASATSSHIQGDFRYLSPERLAGGERSAANDVWSVGATFVHMSTGQPLNARDTITQLLINISQYKVWISGNKPLGEYLGALNASDFRQQILSRSLCAESTRANCPQLLRILFPHSKRLPPDALRTESDSRDPDISGMSYNSARDELFLADSENRVVRVIRVRHSAGDLRDVYTNTTGDYSPAECVSHERLGHSSRLRVAMHEWREFLLAGGTETQRQRVARDAPNATRTRQ